jgi:hypothetical protein
MVSRTLLSDGLQFFNKKDLSVLFWFFLSVWFKFERSILFGFFLAAAATRALVAAATRTLVAARRASRLRPRPRRTRRGCESEALDWLEGAVRLPLRRPARLARVHAVTDAARVRPALRRDVHGRRARRRALAVVEELTRLRYLADGGSAVFVAGRTDADGGALYLRLAVEGLYGCGRRRLALWARRGVLCREPLLDRHEVVSEELPPRPLLLEAVSEVVVILRHSGAEQARDLCVEGRGMVRRLWDAADALAGA